MLNSTTYKFQYGKNNIQLEIGDIGKQATSSVLINMEDTMVLITVVGIQEEKEKQDFFPLTVNYQERTYAAGRFPGGFFRREGRNSENEILISRLIDRSIRPLFPSDFMQDVQIIATVVSVNPEINPDIVSIIGTSIALSISGIPFLGPIGVARVGYRKGKLIFNPTCSELSSSKLDMIISCTKKSILMIESEAKNLQEKEILKAIYYGYKKQQNLIDKIEKIVLEIGNPKWNIKKKEIDKNVEKEIIHHTKKKLKNAYKIKEKKIRVQKISQIKEESIKNITEKYETTKIEDIKSIIFELEKSIVRKNILVGNPRIDGRKNDMVRKIKSRIHILPRVHGSALFTRGETQSLVSVTLGTERDAQNIDELTKERVEKFLLHYNFPPYSVGEIGILGSPKRREIGHGNLAKKGILAVMPKEKDFPYTIRIVSEITESNGSSSMASICGASLALMDAGVPIKSLVAGISIGLIKEKENFIILTDILGEEDHFGDMDFKISGTKEGITALQLDTKISEINKNIIKNSLQAALKARMQVIKEMEKVIKFPKSSISTFAPRIKVIKIHPNKIKDLIGKGGSVIRSLTEETESIIEIEDDGTVKIAAKSEKKTKYVVRRIEEIVKKIELGKIYHGKISNILDFGAFIHLPNGKEGLVHISHISEKRIKKVKDFLKVGQKVLVKVIGIDKKGKIRLSMKEVKKIYKTT
ncbi:polyribonucleotide nucleotidyltransferase [bacterium endosymbiont of Pedicinus badii]|uniref:polyribonucleotide nucleotidyltransferase n=1 Tax=bacterium endosymbiont of Pedicinus badii TaxID=1719126 RepID=UPI0009BC14E4|nr:polyribonucleotide nucleotidyltransferase [bacterium endosymbiont of Pedicinus badii]OQM34196.1 polynucleotide phosphorylase/polyadenylase [bacterium endosymbiont of Pedicinus badii]